MPLTTLKKIYKYLLPTNLHPVRFQLARLYRASSKRQALFGVNATAILTEGYNGKLLVPVTDMEVGRHLAYAGSYNREEIEYHLSNLDSESEVLIVGAHIGSLLVPIAQHVRCVVGIEANPKTFALLQMNIMLNNLTNVELHHLAAGHRNGEVEFMMHTHNTGTSKIKWGGMNEKDPILGYDHPDLVGVPMEKLDNRLGPRNFDLIIIDIEGSEFLALQGMTEILKRAQRLQVEVVPYFLAKSGVDSKQVIELLKPSFNRAWNLIDAIAGKPAKSLNSLAADLLDNTRLIDIYMEKNGPSR